MSAARRALVAVALVPSVSLGQVSIGAGREPGGTVLGRVCVDADRDGRCGDGDVPVAGARVLAEGGGVAVADAQGRFHLLEVPARVLARDRTAYGGHVVALEGLGVRRAFELGPGGAAAVDLAVEAPPPAPPPPLSPADAAASAPSRAGDGRLRWSLAGRTIPGAQVSVGAARPAVAPDGTFAAEVLLAPGENRFAVVVSSVAEGGAAAIYGWTVHLVRRVRGGDLILPAAPAPLATFALARAAGGGALLVADLRPGLRLRAAGLDLGGGRVAAFLPAGGGAVELRDAEGVSVGAGEIPLAPASGLRAVAALGEVEVAFLGGSGPIVTGRGAAAARGTAGRLAYEAGFDLDDRDERLLDLARPRDLAAVEHALDPVRTFAATGDEGASDDRNPARGRVWARLEADGARLALGGARAGLTGSELGRYDRALFGAKLAAEGALGPVRLEGSAFGATLRADAAGRAPPRAVHDVLRATGGAALWLSRRAVVAGSEAIRVERRDPFTGRAVSGRALVRGVDYEIDWSTGRIVLAAPLASVAPPPEVLTGDPFTGPAVVIVADYLADSSGPGAEDLHGGRVGAALGPLALSAHAAEEERGGAGWRLLAGAAELDLGAPFRVRAEAARTRGQLFARGPDGAFVRSDDGGLAFAAPGAAPREADALHVAAGGGAGPVRLDAWWRERGRGYSDAQFLEATRAREGGARLAVAAGDASGSVRFARREGADPRDPTGLAPLESDHLLARAAWRRDRLGLAVEGVHAAREAAGAPAEETSAGVLGSWRLDPRLTLEAAHHQKLRVSGAGVDPTFTSAGAAWATRASSLGVRGGWGPELGARVLVTGARLAPGEAVYGTFGADPDAPDVLGGAATTLGARQRTGRAELFTEEQFERDVFGLRQARVLGATLTPLRGLQLSLAGERGQRLRLDGSVVARSAAGGAASIVRGPVRLAARGEIRDEGGDDHAAAGGSAEWLVGSGTSLAARVSWTRGTSAGVEGLAFDASLGGAWRGERVALLASGARIVEQRPREPRRDGYVARAAATAEAAARVELGVGAALAIQEVADARDDRITGSARARVRVAGPLDAAVEYARRAPLRGGRLGALDALRVEAGMGVSEGRIAAGYNLVGFGGDGLSPAADTARVYVRAQIAH